MKDRLIEIVQSSSRDLPMPSILAELIAINLIDHGVIVPPCNVGDKVWCVEEGEYSGYRFMGMCGEYAIVCSTYTWCEDFDHQLEVMAEETIEEGDVDVGIIHMSNVFLTKAEAEAKIEELKGGGDDE